MKSVLAFLLKILVSRFWNVTYALLIKTKTNIPKKTHQNETDEIN